MDSKELERIVSGAVGSKKTKEVLLYLDKLDAEESLLDFMKLTWHILEPKRTLTIGKPLEAICEHLEAITHGQIRRLLVNVPPGCTKSLTTNVFWPAWEWVNSPSTRFIGSSYADSLSIRDNRKFRTLIKSEIYRQLWGDKFKISEDQSEKRKIENNQTGFKLATSVGGVGTGERGDRFIVDDPHNIREVESDAKREAALQWFTEVVPTRINDPDESAILVIMQRVHHMDVAGLIISKELGYDHLCLPMEYEVDHPFPSKTSIGFKDWRTKDGELLWEERFSKRHLEEDLKPSLRAWGGPYAEVGQLQQRPTPRGGGLFKRANAQYMDQPPSEFAIVARGWDLAGTKKKRSKYTVGVKMARLTDDRIVILDVLRFKGDPHEVRQSLRDTATQDGINVRISVPQDPGQAGVGQKSDFIKVLHGFDVVFTPESGDKYIRALPFAAQWGADNVWMVRAPWNDAFIAELADFPMGEFSDQVDACSRVYQELIADPTPNTSTFGPTLFQGGGGTS